MQHTQWVENSLQNAPKRAQKQPPKKGLGDRQVGAFSVFWPRHTGGPFIFGRKLRFFQKSEQFRGWCNTTPVRPWKWTSSTHLGCAYSTTLIYFYFIPLRYQHFHLTPGTINTTSHSIYHPSPSLLCILFYLLI